MTKAATRADELAKNRLDARLDEALAETFPASDPVAVSPPQGAERQAPAEPSTAKPSTAKPSTVKPAPGGRGLRDNAPERRFELDWDDSTAVAHYRLSPGAITITHTEVPEALRGRGMGAALVEEVLNEVRRRGLKVVPQCPFVADFIGRHPDFRDLVA